MGGVWEIPGGRGGGRHPGRIRNPDAPEPQSPVPSPAGAQLRTRNPRETRDLRFPVRHLPDTCCTPTEYDNSGISSVASAPVGAHSKESGPILRVHCPFECHSLPAERARRCSCAHKDQWQSSLARRRRNKPSCENRQRPPFPAPSLAYAQSQCLANAALPSLLLLVTAPHSTEPS